VNWRKIKAEYIAGGISQRALAEKYGVGIPAIAKRSRIEKWVEQRKAAEKKSIEKVAEKTAETVADNAVLLEKIKTGLLRKLSDMVENFPNTNAAEMRERVGSVDYIYRMKDLAAVYNSLRDDLQRGASPDIEDLSPLTELLRDE
jgi:hypothetical protein